MKEVPVISSRRHALVDELKSIRDGLDAALMFLEGPRLVQEVLRSAKPIEILVWTLSAKDFPEFSAALTQAKRNFQVSPAVFEAVSDVRSPQGILAITRRPECRWEDLTGRAPAPLLVLDGIQDPGNVATILRTAEAAGAAGVVTTPATAHLFSPKALRGAMGSTLRLPCLEHLPVRDIQSSLVKAGYALVAAEMESPEIVSAGYCRHDWKKPWAILLGQEGRGFSEDWKPLIRAYVHIPMRPPVESLNVAAAAAILLYESLRQRELS